VYLQVIKFIDRCKTDKFEGSCSVKLSDIF
jgi:hypothetical protein